MTVCTCCLNRPATNIFSAISCAAAPFTAFPWSKNNKKSTLGQSTTNCLRVLFFILQACMLFTDQRKNKAPRNNFRGALFFYLCCAYKRYIRIDYIVPFHNKKGNTFSLPLTFYIKNINSLFMFSSRVFAFLYIMCIIIPYYRKVTGFFVEFSSLSRCNKNKKERLTEPLFFVHLN